MVSSPAQGPPQAEGKVTYSGSAGVKSSKALNKAHAATGEPGNLTSEVDVLVHDLMQKQPIPGLTLAVVRHGDVILSRGYGKADLENNVAAQPLAEFRTASIAKPMTAIATMELVQQGKLDLDAPVQQYCPVFPAKTSPDGKPWVVTTRELLSHRGGIRWYRDNAEQNNAIHYASINDAVKHFAADPLLFEPGTHMQYSTYGYVLIGCVLEGVTHENYFDYLQQSVLEPAGMESTLVDNPRQIVLHRVHGYDRGPDKTGDLENAPFFDPSDRIPGGGLLSTSEDLARFASAVMAAKLLTRDTLELMWTPQGSLENRDSKVPPYGLGWGIGTLEGHRVVGHNGGQAGTSTTLKMIPDRNLAVAAMTNLEGAQLDDFAEAILKLYLAEPKPAGPK